MVDPCTQILYTTAMKRHTETGVSSLDLLGDIPPHERALLKVFLRTTIISKVEFAKLNIEGSSSAEINAALKALMRRGWVRDDGKNYTLLQQRSQHHKIGRHS